MKLRTLFALVILIIGDLGLSHISYGQDKGALLPDIDPQDIEIRGQFKARFPGLSRQPILGFDPNMQIYQIDPDRKPFMESGDQVVANLPVSALSRPAPPDYAGLHYAEDVNAVARVGYGSYSSPIAQFWGAYKLNNDAYIGGDLDFSSSDGHLDNRPSSFRFLNANGEFGTRLDEKTELKVHAGVQNDFNYSAQYNDTDPGEIVRIQQEGYNAGAELSRFKNDIAGWKLQADVRSFGATFDTEQNGRSMDEVTYNGSFANRWALGHPSETFTLKVGGRGGNYESGSGGSQSWSTLQGGAAYERVFNYQTNVHAEADGYYITDINEDKFYPGGLLSVDHWFGERLKVTGKVEGKPHVNTVEQLHEQNRFTGLQDDLIHTYTVDVTGEASIKYYRGSKLHGGVTYSNMSNYAFFLPTTESGDAAAGPGIDAYQVNYADATNFKLFAGITHQLLPERFWVSADAYVQHPEFTSGDKIPFEESWGANASVSFRPIDMFTIKGWTNYVPSRKTDLSGNEEVDGFLLVGGQLDIDFTDNIGAYVKGVNLLGEEYQVWKGYQERPFQVYGGLTLKF